MLRKYLAHQRKGADEQAYVFPGHGEGHLTISSLDHVFYRLEERAGITGVRCSPHTMRHTFAVRYLEAGGDVYRLSRLMGHTTIRITEGYLRAIKEREARSSHISAVDRIMREKPVKSRKAPALKVVRNNPPLERFSVIDNL